MRDDFWNLGFGNRVVVLRGSPELEKTGEAQCDLEGWSREPGVSPWTQQGIKSL